MISLWYFVYIHEYIYFNIFHPSFFPTHRSSQLLSMFLYLHNFTFRIIHEYFSSSLCNHSSMTILFTDFCEREKLLFNFLKFILIVAWTHSASDCVFSKRKWLCLCVCVYFCGCWKWKKKECKERLRKYHNSFLEYKWDLLLFYIS